MDKENATSEFTPNVIPIESSNIAGAGWYEKPGPIAVGVLRVAFKNGTIYDYENVAHAWFAAFLQSKSKGRELQVIKSDPVAYPSTKV